VSPADARAFLRLAGRNERPQARDAITHAYFRELALPSTASPTRAAPTRAVQRLVQLVAEAGAQASSPALPVRALPPSKRRNAKREVLSRTSAGRESHALFERALTELQALEPVVASQRLEELAYLANVWIAGGSHAGRRPRPVEALEFAVAMCGAGLAKALSEQSGESAAGVLARIPADLLFRRGYAARVLKEGAAAP
jgi:hypothetical protein